MKNNFKLLTAVLLLTVGASYAQTGVGTTTPEASSVLDVSSTTKGFLMPRMTSTERTAITTPANGLQVFDTDTKSVWLFDATALPAPGKWVESTSSANGEWVHNGTDAIEAKRALANTGINSILDSNGATYKNIGNYDWTTILSANGDPAYSGNPKASALSTEFYTSDALPAATTQYTTGTSGTWMFGAKEYVLKQAHVGGTSSFTTKNYNFNRKRVFIDGVTTAMGSNTLNDESYTINANTTANSASHQMTQQTLEFYGTGSAGNLTGVSTRVRNRGTGSTNGMFGLSTEIQNLATTGNTNTMRAINASITHSSTAGTVASMLGINSGFSITAGATVPNSVIGISNAITNSSTQINAASNDFQGISSAVTNNGANKFTTIRGINLTTTNGTAAGAFTNANGIANTFLNSATSTDPINSLSGYSSLIRHSGGSPIANMYGFNLTTETITTTAGIPNVTYGINNLTRLQNSTTGTATSMFGINNQTFNTGGIDVTNSYAEYNLLQINGSGLSTNAYGSFTRLNLSSSNTGTVTKAVGSEASVYLNAAGSVTNMYGVQVAAGKLSTATGVITNLYGISVTNATVGGTGTVANNYGLHIANVTNGTTSNYSIYSDGGNSYFKDNVGIGTTTATSKLQVVGLPVHADNAAAITAGLTVGAFYHAGDGILRVVF